MEQIEQTIEGQYGQPRPSKKTKSLTTVVAINLCILRHLTIEVAHPPQMIINKIQRRVDKHHIRAPVLESKVTSF